MRQYGAAVINRSPLYVITAYERTQNGIVRTVRTADFRKRKKNNEKPSKIAVF